MRAIQGVRFVVKISADVNTQWNRNLFDGLIVVLSEVDDGID
jgi:hypothetical protein